MRKDVLLLAVTVTSLRGSASLAGALDFWVWQPPIQARLCCGDGSCTSPGQPLSLHIQASADCSDNKAFDKDTHYINQTGTEYPDPTEVSVTIKRRQDMAVVASFADADFVWTPAADAPPGYYLVEWKVDDKWPPPTVTRPRHPRDDDPATGYEYLTVVACPTLKITGPKRTCPGTDITLAYEGCGDDYPGHDCAHWSAPTGTPTTGDGATFTTHFDALNEHTVTVTVGGISTSYRVIVDPPAVTLTVARTTPAPDQPLVRGQNAVYTVTTNPSLIDPEFQWEFYEGTGSVPAVSRLSHDPNNYTWSGTMVAGGHIRVYLRDTACPEDKEARYPEEDDGVFVVAARDWAQEPPRVAEFDPAVQYSIDTQNINGLMVECQFTGLFVFNMSTEAQTDGITGDGPNAGYEYVVEYSPNYEPKAAVNSMISSPHLGWRFYMNERSPAWLGYKAGRLLWMWEYSTTTWVPVGDPIEWPPASWFERVVEVHEGLKMRLKGDTGDNYYWSHWLYGRVDLGYGQPDRPASKEDPRLWAERQVCKACDLQQAVNNELLSRKAAAIVASGNHTGIENIEPDDPPGRWSIRCNLGQGCFTDSCVDEEDP